MKNDSKEYGGIRVVAHGACAQFDRNGKLIKEGEVIFDHRIPRHDPFSDCKTPEELDFAKRAYKTIKKAVTGE